MKKRKLKIALIALLCTVLFYIGTTVAYLFSVAGPVENVFTIGDIKLSLTETTGESYQLIPGKVISKNPKVTVEGGSEDCWLFIKVTKTEYFDDYIESEIEPGWTRLGGYDGVYYRNVVKSAGGSDFHILKNDSITVKDNLTEEKMSGITALPKITFKAYAIPSHSIETAVDAWKQILKEGAE